MEATEDAFSFVVDGAVAVEMTRREGGPVILAVLGPGACVPPATRVKSPGDPIVLHALVPSSVARVPTAAFERMVVQTPSLSGLVRAKLAAQHGELLERVAALAERSPTRRLAAMLLYLGRSVGQACALAPGLRIPLPQHVIGQTADLSRQTSNRCLRQLQAIGLLRVERGMVCVLDVAALSAVASGARVAPVWRPAESCKFLRPDQELRCFPLVRAARKRA